MDNEDIGKHRNFRPKFKIHDFGAPQGSNLPTLLHQLIAMLKLTTRLGRVGLLRRSTHQVSSLAAEKARTLKAKEGQRQGQSQGQGLG